MASESKTFDQLIHELGLKLHDMQRLNENTRRIPKKRRTKDKYEETIEEMNELFFDATKLDSDIRAHEEFIESEYQDDSTFEDINKEMVALKARIANVFGKIGEKQGESDDDQDQEATGNLTTTTKDSVEYKKFVCRIQMILKTVDKEREKIRSGGLSMSVAETANSSLSKAWNSCLSAYEDIAIREDGEEKTRASKIFEDAEKKKEKLELKLQTFIQGSEGMRRLRLKPVEPPTFSGEYRKWPLFKKGFEDMVVFNAHLSETEKTAYLLCALQGEPKRTFELMKSSTGSFFQNWNLLVKVYDNPRKIALDIVQTLKTIPKMSANSADGIRRIYSTVESCLQSLQELRYDTSSWDIWVLDIVLATVDNDTRRLFEESLEDESKIPAQRQVMDFLLKRQHVHSKPVCLPQ